MWLWSIYVYAFFNKWTIYGGLLYMDGRHWYDIYAIEWPSLVQCRLGTNGL